MGRRAVHRGSAIGPKPHAAADNVILSFLSIKQRLIDFPLQLGRLGDDGIDLAQSQAASLTEFARIKRQRRRRHEGYGNRNRSQQHGCAFFRANALLGGVTVSEASSGGRYQRMRAFVLLLPFQRILPGPVCWHVA
jgi:hypothetical protein